MGQSDGSVLSGYRTYFREVLLILIGCVPYAWSLVMIDNISTIPGSVLGISVICNTLFGTRIGLLNILVNVPLMVIGTFFLGRKVLVYTIIALAGTSYLIDLWVPVFAIYFTMNPLILTFGGAVLMGIGSGLILRSGASLAGTTILGKLLMLKWRGMKLGNLLILLDGIIICCGALLLHDGKPLLYSAFYTVVCMKVIDWILYVSPKWKCVESE